MGLLGIVLGFENPEPHDAPKGQKSEEAKAAKAFQAGERLEYELSYLFAKGAEAWLTTSDTIIDGQRLHHLTVGGKTTGLLDMAYPVYDVYHSFTKVDTDLPILAVRDVQEQSYRDYKTDTYARLSEEEGTTITRENGLEVKVPYRTLDIVSLVYYLRNQLSRMTLEKNQTIALPVFFNGDMMKLRIRYKGTKKIKTRYGRIFCQHFVPMVKKGDLFEDEDSMEIWMSADKNHIPMKIKVGLFIGSLSCTLEKAQGVKFPFGEAK